MLRKFPPLQKEILVGLAKNGPMTKNETAKKLRKSYKNVVYAFNSLEKKKAIKIQGYKKYRQQEFGEYWLTHRGILGALLFKAPPEILKQKVHEFYGQKDAEEFQTWCDIIKFLPPEFTDAFLTTIVTGKKKVDAIADVGMWLSILVSDMTEEDSQKFYEVLFRQPRTKKLLEETVETLLAKFRAFSSTRAKKKKVPRGRKDDTIEDLIQDGMLGSEGWSEHKEKKEE